MKKLSLKNVKETLTRKEMRAIAGGYGGTGYGGTGYDGQTCCAILPGRPTLRFCELTMEQADAKVCQYVSLYPNAYWCCGSTC